MLDKYLNKDVKVVVPLAASYGDVICPVSYYGKILEYSEEFIEMDVRVAEMESYPRTIGGRAKVQENKKTLLARKSIISISEQ